MKPKRNYNGFYKSSIGFLVFQIFYIIPKSVTFVQIRQMQIELGNEPLNLALAIWNQVLIRIGPALVLFFLARHLKRKSEEPPEEPE